MEAAEFVFLSRPQSPRLATIKKGAYYAGIVDLYFGLLCEFVVCPGSLVQAGHYGCCFANTLAYLSL